MNPSENPWTTGNKIREAFSMRFADPVHIIHRSASISVDAVFWSDGCTKLVSRYSTPIDGDVDHLVFTADDDSTDTLTVELD